MGVCCVIQINQKNDGVVQIFTWKITQLEKKKKNKHYVRQFHLRALIAVILFKLFLLLCLFELWIKLYEVINLILQTYQDIIRICLLGS